MRGAERRAAEPGGGTTACLHPESGPALGCYGYRRPESRLQNTTGPSRQPSHSIHSHPVQGPSWPYCGSSETGSTKPMAHSKARLCPDTQELSSEYKVLGVTRVFGNVGISKPSDASASWKSFSLQECAEKTGG